jgi:hypothetical protein
VFETRADDRLLEDPEVDDRVRYAAGRLKVLWEKRTHVYEWLH